MSRTATRNVQQLFRPSIQPSVVRRIGSAIARIWTRLKDRRALLRIAALDDRLLDDIGLSRGDVESALASRWHEGGIDQLCDRRDERRRTRSKRAG